MMTRLCAVFLPLYVMQIQRNEQKVLKKQCDNILQTTTQNEKIMRKWEERLKGQ